MRTRWIALVALVAIAGAGLTACRDDDGDDAAVETPGEPGSCEFHPPEEEFPSVDAPGVTDTEIRVGAIVAQENPLGVPFEKAVEGTEAYFCKINEAGGVWGRELKLVSVRDDRASGTITIDHARALVEEENVFAVLPVSTIGFPAGANDYLGETGVPTFGFNLTGWEGHPNLFGERGSYLCPDCPIIAPSYIAEQIDAENVAVLSYGVEESSNCAAGSQAGLEHYGFDPVHVDTELAFGLQRQDLANNLAEIQAGDVDLVVTCMDLNGTVTVAQALDQADLDVAVFSPQGYDRNALDAFGDVLENFYFVLPFWPFELAEENEGMTEFATYMDAFGEQLGEIEFAGWSSAQLFVEGLERAGPEFSQDSVVDAINEIDDWDAGGTREVTDWTIAHDGLTDEACGAYVTVEDGEFVPVFGEPGQPFVCFPFGPTVDDLPADLSDPSFKP